MVSKMNKSYRAEISGILDIEDNVIAVLVEGVGTPINLCDFISDFGDKEVKISISHKQEF